jgi:lipopolysaccharide export system permease protein
MSGGMGEALHVESARPSRVTVAPPMKILDRYLLREYLIPVAYCVSAFFMLFVVYDLFDHLARFVELKTPWPIVIRYYASYLVQVLEYLLPASLLLATLYTMWRFTRHHELVAVKASGVSMARAMAPLLVVGVFFSLVMAFFKESLVPDASQWVADLMKAKFELVDGVFVDNLAYYNPDSRRQWLVDRFDRTRPEVLLGVKLVEEREDGARIRDIVAARAENLDGVWWLFDAAIQEYNPQGGPAGPPRRPANSRLGLPAPRLSERPRDFVNEVKNPLFFSSSDIVRYIKAHPSLSSEERTRRRTDLQGRMAAPWACAIVILFGIPTGARGGRQNAVTGVVLALGLFVSFYAISQIGVLLGKTGVVWPWLGAWMANIVFFTAGLAMLIRMR